MEIMCTREASDMIEVGYGSEMCVMCVMVCVMVCVMCLMVCDGVFDGV